jgi:hypothetical protein
MKEEGNDGKQIASSTSRFAHIDELLTGQLWKDVRVIEMATCHRCGGEIVFRTVHGMKTTIHTSGECSGSRTSSHSFSSGPNEHPCGMRASYVNPNASCPVCGARVFFYESEYGGRVFFDRLGMPWPKHPCTDTSISIRRKHYGEIDTSSGWQPLLISIMSDLDDKIEIRGVYEGDDITIALDKPSQFSAKSPIYLKALGNDAYRLQIITSTADAIEPIAIREFDAFLMNTEEDTSDTLSEYARSTKAHGRMRRPPTVDSLDIPSGFVRCKICRKDVRDESAQSHAESEHGQQLMMTAHVTDARDSEVESVCRICRVRLPHRSMAVHLKRVHGIKEGQREN